MEVRSEGVQVRCEKAGSGGPPVIGRTRLQVWFIRICSSILLWTGLVQLLTVGELWQPHFFTNITYKITQITPFPVKVQLQAQPPPPPLLPASEFFFFLLSFLGASLFEDIFCVNSLCKSHLK